MVDKNEDEGTPCPTCFDTGKFKGKRCPNCHAGERYAGPHIPLELHEWIMQHDPRPTPAHDNGETNHDR